MVKQQDKKRKQDLGIFYTPQEVVNFIFDILNIWKNKENNETKRWQGHKPFAHYPSVIDPACGEGVFLKKAVESGFTGEDPRYKAPFVWGVDLDGTVVNQWEKISILHMFHNNREKMQNHFFHQNGLVPLPMIPLIYKSKNDGLKSFDAVVGNPPYGGTGLQEITSELESALFDFEIWKSAAKKHGGEIANQLGLLGATLAGRDQERLKRFSIEILFIDRFIQLAKDGGYIAIIIPDGILTNSNSDYVREFISRKTRVEAVISLPRDTFKDAGTNAKTSILFLRKLKPNEKTEQDYPVFLSSLESINSYNFQKIADTYEKFYNRKGKNMDKSQVVQITKDQTGREVVMVRADKTLKELMVEKPASRWDPGFWHPIYEKNLTDVKYPTEGLGKYITFTTYGQVGRREFVETGIPYISARTFTFTGIDRSLRPVFIKENSYNDPPRSRAKKNDWLLVGVGVGSVGKSTVVDKDDYSKYGQFGQDVKLIRFKSGSINPYYVDVYIKSLFGANEVARYTSGVSGVVNIDFEEIKAIKIPIIPSLVQEKIEKEYKRISVHHNKAMEAKKKGDDGGYKTNLEIAEKMLKDLISRTEAVIRGEREDIV